MTLKAYLRVFRHLLTTYSYLTRSERKWSVPHGEIFWKKVKNWKRMVLWKLWQKKEKKRKSAPSVQTRQVEKVNSPYEKIWRVGKEKSFSMIWNRQKKTTERGIQIYIKTFASRDHHQRQHLCRVFLSTWQDVEMKIKDTPQPQQHCRRCCRRNEWSYVGAAHPSYIGFL